MSNATNAHPTERFEFLMQRVARTTHTLETYLAAHVEIPEDVQARYDSAINDASDYACTWGFEFDASDYAA